MESILLKVVLNSHSEDPRYQCNGLYKLFTILFLTFFFIMFTKLQIFSNCDEFISFFVNLILNLSSSSKINFIEFRGLYDPF